MWEEVEARIEENERDIALPLRKALFNVVRDSGLRPGQGATKKMVAFEFGPAERMLWEIQSPARNVFLHNRWRQRLEQAGFPYELRPFNTGMKDGERHSALSREWSFGDEDCIVLRMDNTQDLRRLLDLLLSVSGELHLDPAALARWIARLRDFFPGLERFDKPDPDFDSQERSYKLDIAGDLRAALVRAASDQEVADAINTALAKSNLLPWRAYWPISPKGDADRGRLWPALATLARAALGTSENHPAALETFVGTWLEAVPKASADPARQIGEFLFLHLAPEEGVYIRHSVRQDFWLEAVGSAFPDHASIAETYRDERRFMQAVRRAFEDHGLAPRDMIDVQSALWVVHNYKEGDKVDTKAAKGVFTRAEIEGAMDAFDRFGQTGENAEIFDAFGPPRDYWVRSSRSRSNRVYPTKPIVGYLRNTTDIHGGWNQPSGPVSQLHNSGFIIVDSNDAPSELPAKEYVLRGADRIRLCALNYFIEPARERGASEVSIRAGDLAAEMRLPDAFPNICQALGGEKFLQLAQVPPPSHTEPNPSSSTIFTYKLESQAEAVTVTEASPAPTRQATNLILYGPPGTGKTYATTWEAVRLCLGDDAAASLRNDRDALMAAYRRLATEGRIEFVTFHQSFSYEDFVEGLRPTTETDLADEEQSDTVASGGFSLRAHAGVFKVISERARLDTGDAVAKRLDRSRAIYKIALGQRGAKRTGYVRASTDH